MSCVARFKPTPVPVRLTMLLSTHGEKVHPVPWPAQITVTMSCAEQTVVIHVPAALMLAVITHAQRDVSVMMDWSGVEDSVYQWSNAAARMMDSTLMLVSSSGI